MAKKPESNSAHPGSTEAASHEPSMIPPKVLDFTEDLFHVVLTVLLFLVALGALGFTVVRLVSTTPFFPSGMLQAVNDILFVVIILEIARTVIARFSSGFYQLSRFLIIGVIASVRHILSVGSSLTLSTGKTAEVFDRSIIELIVNGGIVIALVIAILITRQAESAKGLGSTSGTSTRSK
jgi:uncharacterized membrane protein (DUF373 family)